jgi:Uma2 family endonuclease
MSTTTASQPITPDDLLRLPDEGRGFELVDGQLRERTMSAKSSYVAGRVYRAIDRHLETHPGGWLFPEGMSYRCFDDDPDLVRRPDVSFIALDRYAVDEFNEEGHCGTVPDLVVEVISPHDLVYDANAKLERWLRAGVKVVWLIDPNSRTVRVETPNASRRLGMQDTLTDESVLPGFSVPVAEFFRTPQPAR